MLTSKKNFDSAEHYVRVAGFVSDLGMPVLDVLQAKPGEKILDLGAGAGDLALKIRDMGCDVVGVDKSQAMVDNMRKAGLTAEVMDAENITFENRFDAVFSNATLHWCKNQEKVVAGVRKALVKGGRFVSEQGGFGNIETIRQSIHSTLQHRGVDPEPLDPWNFMSVARMKSLLEKNGFEVHYIELIPRPTRLTTNVRDWVNLFGNTYLQDMSDEDRNAVLDEVQSKCGSLWDEALQCYFADYVRLRYSATLTS
eukprot:CFRG1825T1